ncbi:glutathione synthetase-like [Archocentrus centrarchus]|uniref:glutathione synthetase-like n=1 Tax=Archocentrus centrarchus TaxID=63155 RepID=UPI0011EA4F7E|nr:glutathione synthetase-like [Archocentrus centrarchus]
MATEVFLQQLITNPDKLNSFVDEAKDWALHHGVIQRTCETPNSSEVVTYIPFTLFPTPVPEAAILQAMAVQTHFNTLVDKISQDSGFLEEALAGTVQADDFTARLFGIYRQIEQEGLKQSITLSLNRSDYMLDEGGRGTYFLKQTEINTIAVGSFGTTDSLPAVHRHMLESAGLWEETERVKDANNTPRMSAALAKAWELYGQQKAVILFLVEELQISQLTHRCIERVLWKRKIPAIRRKFEEVSRQASLDSDKRLFVDGLEVAVVYYRYGYMPDNYTEESWDTRLLMERSLAVKCPDIGTHLAGTKKVQQALSQPGVLERFFPNQPQVVEQIRGTFTGLYTLDMGPEGDQTVAMALANPDKFVLKPQREGGGNNYFGEDIVRVLTELKNDKMRAAYILMDRIQPRTQQNILLRRGLPLSLNTVSYEIGVLGAYVRHDGEIVLNEAVGPILRTKHVEQNDGGVSNGVSVCDTPLLI